ncbi:acyl-CoA N-acyltransferase [Talaromyces proteolyticus]|uniref:Acyl-CoA N-acyltransferase n=1 Tax=Talaromyces proteolyticus TaxID=1131652 RepID=A0AAD4Q3T6_9EURO|nr:acyl-CoA N-acyltransferase [Talaromyces proteolyticus]KAH8702143.1 acyl-CoA N-acyltransferase [Talaromyces proteolyticus]
MGCAVDPFVRSARLGDETAIGMIHVRRSRKHTRTACLGAFSTGWMGRNPRRGVVVVVDESSRHQDGGEGIVGFAMFGPSRDADAEDDQRHIGEVDAVYLRREWTSKGLGRLLMNAVVTGLAQFGYEEATLWVLDTNARARRFYEGVGWAADGSVKEDSIRGRFTICELRYWRSLVETSIRAEIDSL